MKTIREIVKLIKGSKGVATSLIEATATVAVGAVLAGVAVGGAIDAINDSKIQAAIGDVGSIGQGVITFYKDNAFFPLFKNGNETGAGDAYFHVLVSENGTYPTVHPGVGDSHWDVTGDPTAWGAGNMFGHTLDFNNHDSIEGHLIRNELGGASAGQAYPLRGSYAGDPQRGWAGPYVASLPKTDPWGNKYLINVQELHSAHLLASHATASEVGNLPKIAVIVLSAGPNRTIETSSQQPFDNFSAGGDDIVFRVK